MITIRRWGYWTVALWVDGVWAGVWGSEEEALKQGRSKLLRKRGGYRHGS